MRSRLTLLTLIQVTTQGVLYICSDTYTIRGNIADQLHVFLTFTGCQNVQLPVQAGGQSHVSNATQISDSMEFVVNLVEVVVFLCHDAYCWYV